MACHLRVDILRQDRTEEIDRISQAEADRARKRAALRKRRKRRVYLMRFLVFMIAIVMLAGGFVGIRHMVRVRTGNRSALKTPVEDALEEILIPRKKVYECPAITPALLTPNEYSRPGEPLTEVKNIFIHYTANPGTGARQNRDYFDSLAQTQITSASAHFVIGIEGEILQCLPMDEIGYAVKGRNYDSVSIECCYENENGQFSEATYRSLVELCAYLLGRYDLTEFDLMRHYDEGGKICPKYYVEHPEEWERLIYDVGYYISAHGQTQQPGDIPTAGIVESDKGNQPGEDTAGTGEE